MNDVDMKFILTGLSKLKEYFNKFKLPAVCDDIQYIKMLIVQQDKELKRVKDQLWNARKDLLKYKHLEGLSKKDKIKIYNKEDIKQIKRK